MYVLFYSIILLETLYLTKQTLKNLKYLLYTYREKAMMLEILKKVGVWMWMWVWKVVTSYIQAYTDLTLV